MSATTGSIEPADILDASTNGILVVDNQCQILYANRLIRDHFGLERKQYTGRPIHHLIPHLDVLVAECINSGEARIGLPLEVKGLSTVANISPIIKQGTVAGASISLKRMDEYERLADKLDSYKRQNKLFKAIFNASSDGLWIIDGNKKIVAWNPSAESITGFKAEEVVGRRFDELGEIGIPTDDVRYIAEAVETKRRVSTFNLHPRSEKQVLGNATPVLDDHGDILWVVGNEHDLSELNELREQLDSALKATEKAKAELSGLNLSELREHEIVAESSAMLQVLQVATKLASIDASHILITGESGTGKGFLSKFIHNKSAHASQPFIQINCAAVPENLLEAELFGYEKGAFTGAGDKGKVGLIELAQNGTLFLDEIGDMPIRLQAKLLKYLDDHEVMRLGSVKARKIDCAIISATNQDLGALVGVKKFRQDLFFRLNNFQLHIPPLRERPEDIIEFVHFFLRKYNKEYRRRKRISAPGIDMILAHDFPGNIRELRSLCKQAVLMSDETLVDGHIAENLQMVCSPVSLNEPAPSTGSDGKETTTASPNDLPGLIATWIVKNLNVNRPQTGPDAGSAANPTPPLLAQVIHHLIDLGRGIYAQTCRELANRPQDDPTPPPPPEQPMPADTGRVHREGTSLTAALDAREREIFLQAVQHCQTIRELADHLQTSPATALRKLKKHGLSL